LHNFIPVTLRDVSVHCLGGSAESCDHSTASGETLELMVFGWDEGSSSYSITVTWNE
jgi:hypothetical protein